MKIVPALRCHIPVWGDNWNGPFLHFISPSFSARTYFQSKGSSILLSDANYPIFEVR